MKKTPILERVENWLFHARINGMNLTKILVHPSDYSAALKLPSSVTGGLPIKAMSKDRFAKKVKEQK